MYTRDATDALGAVSVLRLIAKSRSTDVAVSNNAEPACDARNVHVPAPKIVTDVPETEHVVGVVDSKLTASPDVDVADVVNTGSP